MGNCQTYNQDDLANVDPSERGRLQLMVKTDTWLRDSYGLFDYENTNISSCNFKSYVSGKLVRTGTKVKFVKENEQISDSQETKDLLNVQMKDGMFWICASEKNQGIEEKQDYSPEELEKIEASPWLVLKSLKGKTNNKGYMIDEGDIIKLGRVKIKILELKRPGKHAPRGPDIEIAKRSGTEPDSPLGDDDMNDEAQEVSTYCRESAGHVCRICLSESAESDNPLFAPCKCAGTMKYVHIKCLQTWLKSKLYIKDLPQVLSYYLKSFECELCKTLFPNVFEIGNTKYGIVEIERPKAPYMLLEILSKDGTMVRGLHLVRMGKKNSIRLGRGHDSDIRITDISVSRFHASIKMEKDGFYIEDNNSKFGTLAYIKKSFPLTGNYENVLIQVGRTVASFSLKRSWRLFSTCMKNTTVVDSEGAVETKMDTGEHNADAAEIKNSNPIESSDRPVVIGNLGNPGNRREIGFGARSDRGVQGLQVPLGGDDDAVELEDANDHQRNSHDIENNNRDLEVGRDCDGAVREL